jgi:cellulose synthase/poly-beta-1,6-N-acetylglucosamine synthase-like glycosyltransferase
MNELSIIARMVFWVCFLLVAYVYVGYPILLGLLVRLFPRHNHPREGFRPSVSLLISAYNEAEVIRKKIENTLQLEYPQSVFEIIVISDCSSDATDQIVSEYVDRGVRLIRQNERLGKSSGLNLAVPRARGEVVVFSDANAMYRCDAIQNLVRHFVDPKIGYVVGNSRYIESVGDSQSSQSEGRYWKLETWLKCKESDFESVVGGDGAIYAIRRELYSPLLPTDINDFLNPLQIIDHGYRGLFDSNVVCFEETADTFAQEFHRKVRIVSRALNAVRRAPGVLNPLRNPRHFWLLASHKILRWLAPFFLLGVLLASLMLSALPSYRWAIEAQIAFYLVAFIGWSMQSRLRTPKLVSLVFYFCIVNAASLVGCIQCFRGSLAGPWTSHRTEVRGQKLTAR